MRMLAALIKIEVVDELCTKTVLRKHAFDSHPEKFGRFLVKNLLRCGESLSARITCMTDIHPVGHLLSSKPYLVSIENDDVVTAIHVRSEARLVLSTENERDSGSKTAEHQVGSINHDPLFLDIASLERYSLVTLCVHCLDF